MSTTDLAPDPTVGTTVAADTDGAPGGVVGALASWVTSADTRSSGARSSVPPSLLLLGCAVLGVLLGVERIDGADTLLDADALPQLFIGWRIGLVYGVVVPLLLGIAVAVVPLQLGARSLAFPRLASRRLLGVGSAGSSLVIVALANNGGPGGGNEDMVDLFLAAPWPSPSSASPRRPVRWPRRCSPRGRRACG